MSDPTPSPEPLGSTPFTERHRALGARMVDFAGWEMPVQYRGIKAEHEAVRERAGLFDIAHMGVVRVEGAGALETLEWLTTNHVARLEPGRAQYSLLCYDHGGVVDDIIVYRVAEDSFRVVVNASNRAKDLEWMRGHVPEGGALPEAEPSTALLALQGPRAVAILAPLTDIDLAAVPYFGIARGRVGDAEVLLARTGYTGEDGFELFVDEGAAGALWDRLLGAGEPEGLEPCGLGARDTLRLEMAYPLYGNEIDERSRPLEARLGWVIKSKKKDFLGREAIEAQRAAGLTRKLIGFELVDRGVARPHHPIVADGEAVGEVTSGTSSPTLGKSIGLGYVPVALAETGREIAIDVRGRALAARVVDTPFVPPHTRR